MADKKFDLGDYVQVNDRIKLFYELFAGGRLVTSHVRTELGPDGKGRVLVEAKAYRTVDDPLPGVGWSWMELPGTTSYTKGSELENTETSAWGRAIGSLGILIDRSIASAQEVQNKAHEPAERPVPSGIVETKAHPAPEPVQTHDGGLIGIAKVGNGKSDFELRQTPAGPGISFRLAQGRQGMKVVALGPLAEAIAAIRPTIEDQRVTVWGSISDEEFTKDGKVISYQVLTLDRIQTPDGMLPADEGPPADLPLFGEQVA